MEGSGNADHDGDSSPMKCLMYMLGIAMNFKKRNLRQKKPRIYFNWRGFLHVCIKRTVPTVLPDVPVQSLLICCMLKFCVTRIAHK